MSDLADLPERPQPPISWRDRVGDWVEWVGVGRLVSSAVVVIAVIAAAYWLLAPPAVASETVLPRAGDGATSTPMPVVATPSVAAVATATVVVHIAGAVVAPGVYEVASGSRAVDAVERAGGVTIDADLDRVNLAAPLADGQRLYVPRVGEPTPPLVAPAGGAGVDVPPVGPVDLNRATAGELEQLPGVGPATASAIIAHRTQHGPFSAVDDLGEVRGIGSSKLEALRGLVTV